MSNPAADTLLAPSSERTEEPIELPLPLDVAALGFTRSVPWSSAAIANRSALELLLYAFDLGGEAQRDPASALLTNGGGR